MKNIDKIKLATAALTTRAKTAFRLAEHAEPQRAFLANFATIGEAYTVDHMGSFVFTFNFNELAQVQSKIAAATGKVIDAHEHNGVLDMTCDIISDKYCGFCIVISHDAYSADCDSVSITLRRRVFK